MTRCRRPSQVLDRVITLATDVKTAREEPAQAAGFDPDDKRVLKVERALRRYLGRRSSSELRLIRLVKRVGGGQLLAERVRERFGDGDSATQLDVAVTELAEDSDLAGHLAQGLALLIVEGVSLDDP